MPEEPCATIVLAAGASTRLGYPKQLLCIGGECLLHRTVRLALEAGCAPLIAVLGYQAERMTSELAGLNVHCTVNTEWRAGMGSSLRCGIREVLRQNDSTGNVMVLVCDQVRLSCGLLSQLLERHKLSKSPITAARYAGRLGTPAIFSRALFGDLMELDGDRGARRLIEQQQDKAAWIDFPEGIEDVDTPQDVERFLPPASMS